VTSGLSTERFSRTRTSFRPNDELKADRRRPLAADCPVPNVEVDREFEKRNPIMAKSTDDAVQPKVGASKRDAWKLPKPQISLRLGVFGHPSDVEKILPGANGIAEWSLVDLLEGLNDTLLAIRKADLDRVNVADRYFRSGAYISGALYWLGYRVDKRTLIGRDISVYSDQPPQLLLRTIEPDVERLLQPLPARLPCRPLPSDASPNESQRRNAPPAIKVERVELGGAASGTSREEMFLYAMLLHHSDLLVAVWSEEDSARREWIDTKIRRAIADGIDVVAIQLHRERPPVVAMIGSERELGLLHQNRIEAKDALVSCSQGRGMSREDLEKLRREWNPTMEFPDAPCNEVEEKSRSTAFLYHPRASFLKLMRLEEPRDTWVGLGWTGYRKVTDTLFKKYHHAHPDASPVKYKKPSISEPFDHASWRVDLGQIYQSADGPFSGRHGKTYRGGLVLSNLVAVLAVILAICGAWLHVQHEQHLQGQEVVEKPSEEVHSDGHGSESDGGHASQHAEAHAEGLADWFPLGLGMLEFLAVLLMFGISLWSVTRGWRLQFTENRMLAEGMRIWRFLMGYRLHTPMPRLPHYLRGDGVAPSVDATWSLWYFRALVRGFPLVQGAGDKAIDFGSALENIRLLAQDQINYHEKNAQKQHFIHELVESISLVLFMLVLFCVGLHLLELRLHLFLGGPLGMFCCVLGPLVIAVLHGLASQLEVQRLRQRSASVAKLLKDRMVALDQVELDATKSGGPTLEDHWNLARESLQISSILIDETAGWSMLYRARDIHAG